MTYRLNEFQFQLPPSELLDATINILKFPELGTSLIVSRSLLAEGETLQSNLDDQLKRLEKQVQDLRCQPGATVRVGANQEVEAIELRSQFNKGNEKVFQFQLALVLPGTSPGGARLMAEKEMFLVGTLATYEALATRGADAGMPADQLAKLQRVRDAGLRSIELASAAGVRLVYGTDLLGAMHDAQLTEFTLRAQVQPTAELLRAATVDAAALLDQPDLGRIERGAHADLLLLDADPLTDITVLTRPGVHLQAVVQGGRTVVGSLDPASR